jgi:ribosomal-protein-serine acetyltransferase
MKKSLYTVKVDSDITLKIRTREEARDLFTLVKQNKEHLRQYLDWVDKTKKISNSEEFITKILTGYKNGTDCDFGIYYQRVMVGSGGFHKIDHKNKSAEIGYWIAKNFEGRGIVSKVVKKLIEVGKKKYKLHRIVIRMDTRNEKSQAIPKRLGFTYEGTMRDSRLIHGRFHSSEIWSLLVQY